MKIDGIDVRGVKKGVLFKQLYFFYYDIICLVVMRVIKLKNVSKYYYSKGVIAPGFTKVSLNFNLGEFVALTGESGSGKSTLINVISGLDSYEDGEMYINGKETSHYISKDWEIYRKKYIGNIYVH